MLKNMKVRTSLAMGFGITIILSVSIIVVMQLIIDYQGNTYNSIINRQVRANELILQCRIYTNNAARNIRDMALDPQDTTGNEKLQNDIDAALAGLEECTTEITNVYPLSDGKVDNYITAMKDWYNEVPDILSAIKANNQREAIRLIKNSCTPKLNDMIGIVQDISSSLEEEQNRIIAKQQSEISHAKIIMSTATIVVACLIMFMAVCIIESIIRPVKQVSVALKGFSNGELDIPVKYSSRSELGRMCDDLRRSQYVLSGIISDECNILEEMADGNFDIKTKDESLYVGELSNILKSLRIINGNLSNTLGQIMRSANQVASEAAQMSNGSQSLAQGATEQASSVEQLASTISEISNNSRDNAHNSEQASNQSKQAGKQVEESVSLMDDMVVAMENISESSNEISKIISTIENIAFQTNILALNAAVEAARAGTSGKGFAVVAEEVRNLATKSDQAAKATKELIERSVNAVGSGSLVVEKVTDSVTAAAKMAGEAVEQMEQVTKAVDDQTDAIEQAAAGIEQISGVVQNNSATAEESAATSQELSGQAAMLQQLVGGFRLLKK